MSEINFSLLQPVDVGALTQQGFATGMAMVKHAQTQNALKGYLANPDDPQAYNALAAYDPDAAASIQRQQMLRRREAAQVAEQQRRASIGAQYASGDATGARTAAIGAGDFDLAEQFSKLDGAHLKKIHDGWSSAAGLAYRMRGLASNEERQAYWQQNRPLLESQGVPPEVLDKVDPTNIAQLDGIISQAQTIAEQIAAAKPQIVATPEGGGVAGYFPQTGEMRTLVAPNAGDHPFGAPVSGGASNIEAKNNPGALRKPGSMEFQTFASPEAGIAAQHAQLGRYLGRGINNISSIIETYAPRKSHGGDNTDAQVDNYKSYVAHRTGIDPTQPISPEQVPVVASAMREFETGHKAKITISHDADAIRSAAQRAIAAGADPQKVKERAAAQGVNL